MIDCSTDFSSFDIAEDQFMGYDVFVCVDKRETKIKIHLFKIINNNDKYEINFYKGTNTTPSYVFNYEEDFGGHINRYSMVNFVVLKESLNFGFLSYRINDAETARFAIFNQPTCISLPYKNQVIDNQLNQGESKTINFLDNLYNDEFKNAEIVIVKYDHGISPDYEDNNRTNIIFTSVDFIAGEINFTFIVKNDYFESEKCNGKINVAGCHPNCKKCYIFSKDDSHQECIENECKSGYYQVMGYPTPDYSRNCCKENVDCPIFFYFTGSNFKICDNKCLTCEEDSDKCLTCYNEKELDKDDYYSSKLKVII